MDSIGPLEIASVSDPARAPSPKPPEMLDRAFQNELEIAASATVKGSQAYESLRNLSEVIGGEYGERVLYELIQNAHDAHAEGDDGQILIRLVIESPDRGDLYVANGGKGFEWANVQALRNIAVSSKTVGEGIGNKGLGFRSIETLTDDPRIYSQAAARKAERFDGYCFRFARPNEILQRAASVAKPEIASIVAETLPRYLASVPIERQDAIIRSFAAQGYATCVHLPLGRAQAIRSAEEQVEALVNSRAPLLLFLDRLSKIVIEIERNGQTKRKTLRRKLVDRLIPTSRNSYEVVSLEPGAGRYLVTKSVIEREPLLAAIEESVDQEPQLAKWRKWQGTPYVSVGIPLGQSEAQAGVAYNFLPMALDIPSPIHGHIDAPFYASINRKEADYSLPLNAFLLDEIAKCAATAASELRAIAEKIGRAAIFDLAAWDPDDVDRLSTAWESLDKEWDFVEVVPAAGGSNQWSSIRDAWIWNESGLRLLRVRRLVKAGVEDLVDSSLGERRLARLADLTLASGVISNPSSSDLAEWFEMVALSLLADKVPAKTWGTFYEEVHGCLGTVTGLHSLQGRQLFIGSDGKLHRAMSSKQSDRPLFIRDSARGRRRSRDRASLPPSSISKKFCFVSDSVDFSPKLVDDFVRAGLVRPYDPLEILENLHALFGDRPAPGRREDVLRWGFDVWRAEGSRVEAALAKANIWVETKSGWKPPSQARFSAGWTPEGEKLALYLAEAAPFSPDCVEAADFLLPEAATWAPKERDKRKDWVSFLKLLGVREGLPLLPDPSAPKGGTPSYIWHFFLRNIDEKVGRTTEWSRLASAVDLPNPYTSYQRRGELWRLPGQQEHALLPTEARHRLCELILALLAQPGGGWLQWHLGRYDREYPNINERHLPTPAAAFLKTAKWLPIDGDDVHFKAPAQLWSMQERRHRPPRFIPRLPDRLAELIADNEHLRTHMYGRLVRLGDWGAPDQTLPRLNELAAVADKLEASNRAEFRRSYLASWTQLLESAVTLPRDFPIVVQIGGSYECRTPAEDGEKIVVYVSANLQSAEARAASSANLPILELEHEGQVEVAISLLDRTGVYDARAIEHGGVQVMVDGTPFVPSYDDPLLATGEFEWLVDAAILSKEIAGRRTFEDAISSSAIADKLARVRLRFARHVKLAIAGSPTGEALPFYGFQDSNLPTLIIGEDKSLDLRTLAEGASVLQQLIDRRFRSFETLLVKLAWWGDPNEPLQRPTDYDFARALGCKVETIRDYLAEREGDNSQIISRLVPVVAYYSGVEAAKTFEARCVEANGLSSLEAALAQNTEIPLPAAELVAIAAGSRDLAEMRKRLGLDFRLLNEVLVQLGGTPLSNEAELRRLFDVWKNDLRAIGVDRLRRHFWRDYKDGASLEEYVRLRTLEFLVFPDEWALALETVTRKDVADLLDRMLEGLIGPDAELDIPKVAETSKRSQRQLRNFCETAAETVSAWCYANNRPAGAWQEGTAALLRLVDQKGLFDFGPVVEGQEIAVLSRAGVWPPGMPQSLDLKVLGLDPEDLDGARRRAREEEEEAARRRRTISFAGEQFDTASPSFAAQFMHVAQESLDEDAWLKRSKRRLKLAVQDDAKSGGRSSGGGKGGNKRRPDRLSDDVKGAMGFASELLASRYLADKHKQLFREDCWVSGNRSLGLLGGNGDDSLGYDFEVNLVEGSWKYEVKSSLDDSFEFELTQNEMRVAASLASDGKHRYRILYVPFVFDPSRWRVMELPNPLSEKGKHLFRTIGSGSTRLKFGTE